MVDLLAPLELAQLGGLVLQTHEIRCEVANGRQRLIAPRSWTSTTLDSASKAFIASIKALPGRRDGSSARVVAA